MAFVIWLNLNDHFDMTRVIRGECENDSKKKFDDGEEERLTEKKEEKGTTNRECENDSKKKFDDGEEERLTEKKEEKGTSERMRFWNDNDNDQIALKHIQKINFIHFIRVITRISFSRVIVRREHEKEEENLVNIFRREHEKEEENLNSDINVHAVGITKFVFKEKNELKIKREEIRKKEWKFIEGLFEFEKLFDYCEDKDRDEDDYLENGKVISKL
ncbi:hypothetical protein Glove_21g254 [Diversispora epigaea]|uniref:Uncharacterized protein n=1 Tax=Diversispora epigaea TaxID=1348612 RepID=A0A397JVB9_9GLOM|nr:hypothetical protein Glove_21g254 [Diversispora epigaea]